MLSRRGSTTAELAEAGLTFASRDGFPGGSAGFGDGRLAGGTDDGGVGGRVDFQRYESDECLWGDAGSGLARGVSPEDHDHSVLI